MKVLISSASFGKINADAINALKAAGYSPVLNPHGRKLEFNDFVELVKDAVGMIAGTEKITAELLDAAPKLRAISRYGVGTDSIDMDAARKKGIVVTTTDEAPSQAVAELALALILNLHRHVSLSDRTVRAERWDQTMGRSLFGKTLGIVGLGRIGRALVELTHPFGVKVVAYDVRPNLEFVKSHKIELVPLERLLSESDIVSIHAPSMKETHHMIGKKELGLMKRDAVIVNTARGSLIDEAALIEALEKKQIGGAALDAFEKEPYKGELKRYDNVVLTPHVGSFTKEARIRMEKEAVENLIAALKGVSGK